MERHRTYMYTCKYSPNQMGVSMAEREQVMQVSFNCLFTRGESARGYSPAQFTWNQETLLCGPYTLSFFQISAPNLHSGDVNWPLPCIIFGNSLRTVSCLRPSNRSTLGERRINKEQQNSSFDAECDSFPKAIQAVFL